MKLSIVVPVFNEESTITQVLAKLLALSFPFDVEVIVVDDGSTDRTAEEIKLFNRNNVVKVHSSLINLGKGAAVRFGIEYADGDYIIVQDADLELDPADILRIVEPIRDERSAVVYGSRFKGRETRAHHVSWFTILANRVLTGYTNILYGSRLTDMATAYKLVRADIMKSLNLRCVGFEFDPEITSKLLRLGHAIMEVPISYQPRSTAEGKKISWRDGVKFLYYITKYRLCDPGAFVRQPRRAA